MESFSEISVVAGFIYRRARGGPPIKRTFEIPDVVEDSNVAMFAHDTKLDLLKEVKSAADVVSLQSDLNRLEAWSKDSGLTFNETKCKAQRISRKLKPKGKF